jgi:hypothetical protein
VEQLFLFIQLGHINQEILDFVLTSMFVKGLPEAMKEIGFIKKVGRHYVHPECKHLHIEFPGSFLEIGEDNKIKPDELEWEGVKIKILSPIF